MKTFTINIHPILENIDATVKNGAKFSRCTIKGDYETHEIFVNEFDLKRIKRFAVKYGNDKSSSRGKWYAHCNGFAMNLIVNYKGNVSINTYRPYGQYSKK